MNGTPRTGRTLAILLLLVLVSDPALGRDIQIGPAIAGDDEEFERVANTLQPGDTLTLLPGTYSQTARRAITCVGTAEAPILIRSAPGGPALLTRPADQIDTQNNIEVVNSAYLILRDLRFQGGNTGVRFMGGQHVTLEGCEIFDVGNNGIAMNSGNSDAFTIRRNHIHHTGLSTAPTEGEGMYLGCNNDQCRVTRSLVEGNYIHHLRGTSSGGNDGIEVKVGSYGNTIRNNVIHDTNIGSRFPGILVYGGGPEPNIVEGNAIWNCGSGIQVVSDAVVRNNIIFSSDIGIEATPHTQVAQMRNVTIAGNTLYGNDDGVYIRWSTVSGMVLANNAIYSPGATAVNASGLGNAGVTVQANIVEGSLSGATVDGARFVSGGTASAAFADPARWDFWPRTGSPLRRAAQPANAPPFDFNETPRTAPYDVGAYETEGLESNPGWPIQSGFKTYAASSDRVAPAAVQDLSAP